MGLMLIIHYLSLRSTKESVCLILRRVDMTFSLFCLASPRFLPLGTFSGRETFPDLLLVLYSLSVMESQT